MTGSADFSRRPQLSFPRRRESSELCNECGRSVAWGSGRFVNRVVGQAPCLSLGSGYRSLPLIPYPSSLIPSEMGKPFPEGDYLCEECDLEVARVE